jgi:filamentous hemagglutinin family protein
MNAKQYKTIYSKIHGCLIAVAETASNQGKATGASVPAHCTPSAGWGSGFCGALSTTFAFVTLAWASPAWAQVQPAPHALPTGGQVVQGAVQFNTHAQQLNILQGSDRAAVNWQSFDIGAAAKVNVVQPSAQSVLLNRVGGESPSQIFGQLQANGQVILVNPNGMVFGKDGSVSAAGFTGSTLNISDADFMAGKERYTRSGTAAAASAIVNRGLIQAAPGGYVALLGASVSNEGAIVAPQGNVFMAAADAVTLPSPTVGLPIGSSGRIRLELTPASISAAVANHKGGTIVTEGGQVYLQAAALNQAMATVLQSGRIDTTGVQGGQVHVLADGGHIRVDGSIQANSTGTDEKGQPKAGGDIYIGRDKDTNVLAAMGDVRGAQLTSKGGFVETSGAQLKTDGISVSAKDWLLDPSDITISNSASSNVTGTSPDDITPNGGPGTSSIVQVSTIQSAINAGTNVTIKTTNASNPSGAGNITIANALSLNNTGAQDATLSLIADNGIIQNAAITATGSRLVHISMTANGQFQGINAASNSSRGVAINAGITTNGNITLTGNTLTGTNQNGGVDGIGTGVYINRQTLNAGASDVTITGTATNGAGVFVLGNSVIRGGNITINGTSNTTATGSGRGVHLFRDATTTIAASNNLSITGTVSGPGTGHGLRAHGGNGGTAILMTAGGTATLRGIQRGNANNTTPALYLSGFRVNAAGDVTLQAEAASSNSVAIHMNREPASLNGYDDAWRMQVRSSNGNVLIQSNQGAILGQDTGNGVNIAGRNVTLDNTGAGMTVNGVPNANGGSINLTTGAIVLGSGTSTYSATIGNDWSGFWVPLGVSLSGGPWPLSSNANVTATGNLTIGGSSNAAQGVVIGNPMSVTGNIHLASRTSAANTIGLNILQALTAAGQMGLTGESTNASPGVGLNIGAAVSTTGINSSTTLTSTTGAVSGTGNITTAAGNTGAITVNAATAGTLSGVIGGGGAMVKQGLGTTTLTGTNTYTGTTTISAGTLQLGNGGTTGSLGTNTGAITNNGTLAFNRSNSLTLNNTISGTGALTQAGTGTTILSANNSYGGSTTISAGALLVGNGGSTGTLGVGDVRLANGGVLAYSRNTDTVIDQAISGNGSVNATITGHLDVARNIHLNSTGTTVNLSASGHITQSAGSITAANLFLNATGGGIGTTTQRINSNVGNLALTSAGDQFLTQVSNVNLAARTTSTGSIDVKTTHGTLRVTTVHGMHGVTAAGTTGSITLEGHGTTGNGITLHQTITANNGNVSLTGTTASTTDLNAGIFSSAPVSARNITLLASATAPTGKVLGFYDGGGTFNATEQLSLTGNSINSSGLYSYRGSFRAGTGMTLVGNSIHGIGFGADYLDILKSGSTGGISITGSTTKTDEMAVYLDVSTIRNEGGNIAIHALGGQLIAS